MGTNYYLRKNLCAHCGRYDQLHIGKSSGGWTFSFQGFRDDYDDPKILSFADWKREIEKTGSVIYDEYGKAIRKQEFYALVEKKRTETENHTLYSQKHHPDHARNNCWLDDEGNSFSEGDFC